MRRSFPMGKCKTTQKLYIVQKHDLEHGCSKDVVARTAQHGRKKHVIEDINHKDANSHAQKMLQIPANEKRHTQLDSEKNIKTHAR